MWKEYTNAVLGLCVGVVAFLGLTGTTLTWTLVVLGVAILILGLWGAGMWEDYTNAVLGLCVVAVAFLGLTGVTLAWTLGILGAAVLILGLWGAGALSASSDFTHSHA
ncbi:DUF677 domain-containing protein [Patescibacteria group bacterium]|nr:DUF677 domain-containing protein [Patescibacteria group bacterium]